MKKLLLCGIMAAALLGMSATSGNAASSKSDEHMNAKIEQTLAKLGKQMKRYYSPKQTPLGMTCSAGGCSRYCPTGACVCHDGPAGCFCSSC